MANTEHRFMRTDQRAVPTILIVASDRKMLKLMDMALSIEFPCDVVSLNSGRGAIETAKHVSPDLVIIDTHLLDDNALELVDHLHAVKEMESVPTLLVNTPEVWGNMPQRTHTIFLSEPFVLVDFYTAVNTSLGRSLSCA